jgi:putative PIN family toxin of toxin-antitoxin system
MRIVLDTNVLVSGLLNPHGAPGRVVDLLLDGKLRLLYDDRILSEYLNVLARPHLGIQPEQARAVVGYVRLSGERVTALPLPQDALPDAGDLAFAEAAITGKAEALVSGNLKHFAGLEAYGVNLLSPAAFLKKFL